MERKGELGVRARLALCDDEDDGRLTHLCLDRSGSLGAQHLDCLEDVHHPLVPHPLQHYAEGDEHACPAHPSTVGYTEVNIYDQCVLSFYLEYQICLIFLNGLLLRMGAFYDVTKDT